MNVDETAGVMLSRNRHLVGVLVFILVVVLLGACTSSEGNGNDAGGSEPETTPTEDDEPENDLVYDLIATEKTTPPGTIESTLDLVENQEEFEELWEEFQFDESTPEIDWDGRVVIFAGTGESGTCPLKLQQVEYDADEPLLTIDVGRDTEADTPCTDDWTPRAFVLSVDREIVAGDSLEVSLVHSELGPGEIHREDVLGQKNGEVDSDDAEVVSER